MNRNETAREATLSVLRDTGSKIILTIKIPGLKKKSSLVNALFGMFKKANDPFRLSTNAHFVEYKLTETSINFSVDVYEDATARKARSELKQNYFCKVAQFPSRINPDSAEFELAVSGGGECYFILTCIKLDNLSMNWKEYQSNNGTLDVASV